MTEPEAVHLSPKRNDFLDLLLLLSELICYKAVRMASLSTVRGAGRKTERRGQPTKKGTEKNLLRNATCHRLQVAEKEWRLVSTLLNLGCWYTRI